MGELHREPTASEIGVKLGLNEDAVVKMQEEAKSRQVVSWEENSDSEGSEEFGNLCERTADEKGKRPDANLLCVEERSELLACIAKLPRLQALVVVLHYLKDSPLGEIAKLTGLTASRISQLHHQALNRLKLFWEARL